MGYGVLGETKFGLSHELISPYYMGPESSMEKRRIVRDYNHQDTWLSYRLLEKFKYMFRLQGVARRTSLPMEMVLSRGQGIKSEMLILSACKREGFVAPTFATMREKLSKGGWGMDMSKYDPSLMGERYRDDELFDEDDDEDEEGEQAVKNRVPMERELHYNVFADECYLVHATEEQVLESQRNELWRGEGSQRRPTLQPENGRVLLFFACPKSQALLGVAELLWRDEGRVKWLIQIPLVRANLPECLRPLANGQKLSPGVVMLAFLKLDGRGGKTGAGEKYKGAVVLKIMHGFYRVPVWVCR